MLARFFIDRPVFAWVISIVIVLVGWMALVSLPIAQYPAITPPTIQVACAYPGANAQVVADTVAAPIEQQINGVEKMMYMSSQCNNDGSYSLVVTFKLGVDLDIAQVMVQNRVSQALPMLPDVIKATGVTVKKQSPSILLVVNLFSDNDPATGKPYYDQLYLSNFATIQVKDALARVDGVGDVLEFGQQDYSMRVWLDPGQAVVAQSHRQRCDQGVARAERASGGRADRPTAGADGARLSVHHDRAGAADGAAAVRQHRRQDRVRRAGDLSARREPIGARRPQPGHDVPARRQAVRRPGDLSTADGQRAGNRRARALAGCAICNGDFPTSWNTPSSTTRRCSSRNRSTKSSTRCATPSFWSPSSCCSFCRTGRR